MKKLAILLFVLLVTAPVLGQWTPNFTIEDPNGAPLMPGDTVEIISGAQHVGHGISDAWFRLYRDGLFLTEIHIPFGMQHFTIGATYEIEGYADLYVGEYTWTDEVELVVATYFVTQQFHWMSYNSLPVYPTTEVVPATSTWGIILLLLLFPAIWLWKR